MDTNEKKLSILMFPWLAHGHINPFLELAKELTKRNFFIHFCSTPILLTSIKKKIENYPLIQLVELHLPSMPELPPHHHTTNGLPPHLMPTLKKACEMSNPNFSNILDTLKPDLLIVDVMQSWVSSAAKRYNIPEIPFFTSSAAMAAFFTHMIIKKGQDFPFPAIQLHHWEIERSRRMLVDSVEDVKRTRGEIENYQPTSNMRLIKSLNEIEGKYIEYFSVLTKSEILPVGSLVQDPSIDQDEDMDIIEWLSKKEEASTVFVSFGSEYFLTYDDMEEIAHGLELSNVNFIWVIRFPSEKNIIKAHDALPDGFLERVRERGIVIEGWAPQARILFHKSIGGIVSHCGWGSVMESIKLGVPIIAMPMHLDQPPNARLVVEIGVAMEVVRESSGKLCRKELAKVIREVVVEKNGEDVRRKARELRDKIRSKGTEEIDLVAEKFRKLCKKSTEQE